MEEIEEQLEASPLVNKGGRPTSFRMEMLPQVRKMARGGLTEIEIADVLGVDRSTLTEWQAKYAQFSRALQLGKSQSNKRVARALFHRAVGYTHDSVKIFNDKGEALKVPYREHVAPDVNAIKFFLTNRDPENWQDRTQTELSGSVSLVAATLSSARQRALAAKSTAPVIEATVDSDSDDEA